jgi:hypothetical protein
METKLHAVHGLQAALSPVVAQASGDALATCFRRHGPANELETIQPEESQVHEGKNLHVQFAVYVI